MYRVGEIFYWKSEGISQGFSKVEFMMVERVNERNVWLKSIGSSCVYQEVKRTDDGREYTFEIYIPDKNPLTFTTTTIRRIINDMCTSDLIASRRKSQKSYQRYRQAVEFDDADWIYK